MSCLFLEFFTAAMSCLSPRVSGRTLCSGHGFVWALAARGPWSYLVLDPRTRHMVQRGHWRRVGLVVIWIGIAVASDPAEEPDTVQRSLALLQRAQRMRIYSWHTALYDCEQFRQLHLLCVCVLCSCISAVVCCPFVIVRRRMGWAR